MAALEVEALKKQIGALEQAKQESESKLSALAEERGIADEAQANVQLLEKAVTGLDSKLDELQTPWWKKWFTPA